jgi:hypothetical protein
MSGPLMVKVTVDANSIGGHAASSLIPIKWRDALHVANTSRSGSGVRENGRTAAAMRVGYRVAIHATLN